jgi:hypothetical protein
VGAGGAAGADLDLGVDRNLPGRPGHLGVRQPGAGHDRQQLPGHGAAHDLDVERSGGTFAFAFAGPDDGITQGHAEAEPEEDACELGFPGRLTDGAGGRIAVRDRESGSVSRRFGATLGGVFDATLGGVEHRVPTWC